MSEWVKCSERLPESIHGKHRWLVMLDCDHEAHKAVAWDFPYPCGEINIAYFWGGKWSLSSHEDLHDGTFVTHWMPLPNPPEENK